MPGAQLAEALPHELVFTLPYAGALDGSFAMVFQELDRQLDLLGLSGYGISDTSLEEVWGLVGSEGWVGICSWTAGELQRVLRAGGQLGSVLRRWGTNGV